MKRSLIALAAAAGAAMMFAAPAPTLAQGVGIEVPGVGVHIGEPRHERWREREVRGGRHCRTVTVQRDTPYGTRTKTRKECD